MKFLVIYTGGTIGSSFDGTFVSLRGKSVLLTKYAEKYGIDFEYDEYTAENILSENSNETFLEKLLLALKEKANKNYDAVFIAHGTDTLSYTAAYLYNFSGEIEIPVCLISSVKPLEEKGSNGVENLRAAVLFAKEGCGGIFIPYKNEDDNFVRIHSAKYLAECKCFENNMYSHMNLEFGKISACGFTKNPKFTEHTTCSALKKLSERRKILKLNPAPSFCYPEISNDISAVMICAFHTGAVNTADAEAKNFYKKCFELGIPIYLVGENSKTHAYESTVLFDELHLKPVYDVSPENLYIRLTFAEEDVR